MIFSGGVTFAIDLMTGSSGTMFCSSRAVLDAGFVVSLFRGMSFNGFISTSTSSGGDLRLLTSIGTRESSIVISYVATSETVRFLCGFVIFVLTVFTF